MTVEMMDNQATNVLRPPALIRARGLGLTYPGPPPLESLHDCDLDIGKGERVAIVGPSGSGKSTLLNILGLLEKPTAGDYWLEGSPVGELNEAQRAELRASSIGFVFQSFHLLEDRTANENVQLAMSAQRVPRRQRHPSALALLDEVGLAPRSEAPASQLSGGERQRVAVARALVGNPLLLLCDEPTGNLDSQATEAVLELLARQQQRGVTVVVVTHDDDVADWAARTVRVRDGAVTADQTRTHA